MNGATLGIVREFLFFSVPQAASYIGKVHVRTWRYWESDHVQIPVHIAEKMGQLVEYRKLKLKEYREDPKRVFIYCSTIDEWREVAKGEDIFWRPNCSILAELASEGIPILEFSRK